MEGLPPRTEPDPVTPEAQFAITDLGRRLLEALRRTGDSEAREGRGDDPPAGRGGRLSS